MKTDPSIAFQLPWETWEEIIAGAYKKAGFEELTLTPRSGDHGRDVIAIKKGICSIRVIDQVKAYKPPHLVAANDVRALISVLHGDGASKGCLSTTSDFAPMIKTDPTERRSFRGLKNWRQGRRGKRPSVEPNRIIISVVFVESLNEWAVRRHWQAAAPKWISLSHGI